MEAKAFEKQKQSSLSGVDLSRKGSIDAPIHDLVNYVNEQSVFFTTSSCSGRILVFENQNDVEKVQKKGCVWLYTTHSSADLDEVMKSLHSLKGQAVFKFEPLILHIQCLTIEDAQKLHAVAIASGLRNSGISIGAKGKIIVAVRSTHSMEVPLSDHGKLLVSKEYIEYIVQCANAKMRENTCRIDRFYENLKQMMSKRDLPPKKAAGMHMHSTSKPAGQRHSGGDRKNHVGSGLLEEEDLYSPSLFDVT